ncbi:transposase [Cobetia marina]|nr:transposase [Cobetia marina]
MKRVGSPSQASPPHCRLTAAFKARIVEACQQAGASVAGVALEYSLNANLVHNWIRTTRKQTAVPEISAFVPGPMTRD